jgi:Cu+-exporting ATPase
MTVVLVVGGMMCQKSCANEVQQALLAVPGVKSAVVSYATSMASIELNASVPVATLVEAVEVAGYDAKPDGETKITLGIEGMTCSSCSNAVTKCLETLDGVDSVVVSLKENQATVVGTVSAEKLIDEVECIGFGATLIASSKQSGPSTTILAVEGMTCSSCSNAVTKCLETLDGVDSVEVSLLENTATIVGTVSAEKLADEVECIGFGATLISSTTTSSSSSSSEHASSLTTILTVEGMTCSSCSNAVTKCLETLDGVDSVVVSRKENQATVVGTVPAEKLIDEVECIGFGATLITSSSTPSTITQKGPQRQNGPGSNNSSSAGVLLHIEGMRSRSACRVRVQQLLQDVPGVLGAAVNFTEKKATMMLSPTRQEKLVIEAALKVTHTVLTHTVLAHTVLTHTVLTHTVPQGEWAPSAVISPDPYIH